MHESARSMDVIAHLHVCKVSGLCGAVARQTPLSPKNNIPSILIRHEAALGMMQEGVPGRAKLEFELFWAERFDEESIL